MKRQQLVVQYTLNISLCYTQYTNIYVSLYR